MPFSSCFMFISITILKIQKFLITQTTYNKHCIDFSCNMLNLQIEKLTLIFFNFLRCLQSYSTENGISPQFNTGHKRKEICFSWQRSLLLLCTYDGIPSGGRHNICGWPNCLGTWDDAVGGGRSEEAVSVGLAPCWKNHKGHGP